MKKITLLVFIIQLTFNVFPQIPVQINSASNTYSHLAWPFPSTNWTTQTGSPWHKGSDIYADDYSTWEGTCGKDFKAPFSGRVIYAGYLDTTAGYGRQVVIQSDDNASMCFRIAHLESINVNVGDWVCHNTVLGKVGTTGSSSGCHAHVVLYRAIGATELALLSAGDTPGGTSSTLPTIYAAYFDFSATELPTDAITATALSSTAIRINYSGVGPDGISFYVSANGGPYTWIGLTSATTGYYDWNFATPGTSYTVRVKNGWGTYGCSQPVVNTPGTGALPPCETNLYISGNIPTGVHHYYAAENIYVHDIVAPSNTTLYFHCKKMVEYGYIKIEGKKATLPDYCTIGQNWPQLRPVNPEHEMDEFKIDNDIAIAPNPAHNQFMIASNIIGDNRDAELVIYNLSGSKILKQKILLQEGHLEIIDCSTWPNGMYLMSIFENGKVLKSEKIIKQ